MTKSITLNYGKAYMAPKENFVSTPEFCDYLNPFMLTFHFQFLWDFSEKLKKAECIKAVDAFRNWIYKIPEYILRSDEYLKTHQILHDRKLHPACYTRYLNEVVRVLTYKMIPDRFKSETDKPFYKENMQLDLIFPSDFSLASEYVPDSREDMLFEKPEEERNTPVPHISKEQFKLTKEDNPILEKSSEEFDISVGVQ